MAQRYILALDYVDHHAHQILRKHAQKRPLGDIESKHRYRPPQPVLSCRTVDIDLSGTRTYRPRSTTDIIEEQHKLIHQIYSKSRNVTSAPHRRARSPSRYSPDENTRKLQRINIEVQGRPITTQSQVALKLHVKRPKSHKRPKTTGAIKTGPVSTEGYMVIKADPDLLETNRSYRQLTNKIHEHWEPENHDLSKGKFVRGQKRTESSGNLDSWLTFGGTINEESQGVIETFAQPRNHDFYSIEGGVGSRVAEQLQKGDKIRIGINGIVQSDDLKVRKWMREGTFDVVEEKPVQTEMANDVTSKHRIVPLCWDDQVTQPKAKVLSPRGTPREQDKPDLCENHPVVFRKLLEDEDSSNKAKSRVLLQRDEGYKVSQRQKSRPGLDGKDHNNKITVLSIDHKSEEEEKQLESLSVDEILKQTLSGKEAQKADGIRSKDNFRKSSETLDRSTSANLSMGCDFMGQKDSLRSVSKTSLAESHFSAGSDHAWTPKVRPSPPTYSSKLSATDLSVGPIGRVPSEPMSLVRGSSSTSRIGSEKNSSKLSSKSVVQGKSLHRTLSGSNQGPVMSPHTYRMETEYIKIASPIKNPNSHTQKQRPPEMYSSHAVTNDAIRQVGNQNKVIEPEVRQPAPSPELVPPEFEFTDEAPISQEVPGESPRLVESPSVKPTTPALAISIPTAEDYSDRDSVLNSPSHRSPYDQDDSLTNQQRRELNMRDAQIDQIASLLSIGATIGPNQAEEEASEQTTPSGSKRVVPNRS